MNLKQIITSNRRYVASDDICNLTNKALISTWLNFLNFSGTPRILIALLAVSLYAC
jgi:hypothetical protein